jgi:hypothetical protein
VEIVVQSSPAARVTQEFVEVILSLTLISVPSVVFRRAAAPQWVRQH